MALNGSTFTQFISFIARVRRPVVPLSLTLTSRILSKIDSLRSDLNVCNLPTRLAIHAKLFCEVRDEYLRVASLILK